MSLPYRNRHHRRNWAALLFAVALLAASTASADVAPPPPDTCPTGSTPDSCHGGAFCRPRTCTGNTDCSGGMTCEELELCMSQVDCQGGWSDASAWTPTVEGACPGGTPCVEGTCETVRVCVPSGTGGSSAGGSSAGGSSAGGSSTGGSSTGGSSAGGSATGGGPPAGPTVVESDCGCRLPHEPNARLPWWVLVVAVTVLGGWRARRRRSTA